MEYRKEIDGLRAISVLSVIFFHAGFTIFRGGFIGVDIFFVISGYLITSILLTEKKSGTFTLINFYERRARRILPALFIVLFACLPLSWQWLVPTDMKNFSQSLVAVSGFVSNILFYNNTGYFDTAADWKPLLHTWSLAVEEQYYLFFPLVLMLMWKLGQRWLLLVLVVIATASLAHAQWSSSHNPAAAFYLLPARGWELLIGAFVAFYLSGDSKRQFSAQANQFGSAAGLLLIIYAILALDKHTPFPSFYTLIPTLGAALIILFARAETIAGKLLGYRFLVGIGLISYSAYLWHWPLFVFARHQSIPQVPSQVLLGSLAMGALILGFISWKYIETPFRNRQTLNRKNIFVASALCMIVCITFGMMGHYTQGFANRIASTNSTPAIDFPTLCFYQPDNSETLVAGAQGLHCWLGKSSAMKKAILIGDSLAGNYEPFWDIVGKKTDLHINAVTTNYCVPSRTEDWTGPEHFKAKQQCLINRRFFADNLDRYELAIFAGNWMDYSSKNIMQGVLDSIDYAAARSTLVVIMAAPKAYDFNPIDVYNKSLLEKTEFDITKVPSERDAPEVAANLLLEQTAQQYSNVLYIDRDSLFNVDGIPSEITREKIPFSFDGLHISTYGSRSAAAAFLQSQKYKDLITMLQVPEPKRLSKHSPLETTTTQKM